MESALEEAEALALAEALTEVEGVGAASSEALFDSAKIASKTIPTTTRIKTVGELFFAGAVGILGVETFAAAGVLDTEVVPREGTGGICIFAASTLAAETFFEPLFADFLGADFLGADFFTVFFALDLRAVAEPLLFTGFFAATFFTTFFVDFFAGRLAGAFFFAATIHSSHNF